MKYGTCVSLCLSSSCQRENDPEQMGHRQRFFELVMKDDVVVLRIREDAANTFGCGWLYSVLAN